MYNQPQQMQMTQMQQAPGVQLVSQLYQLDQIQQNFNFSIGTPYQEIEMMSPQICKGVAFEVQSQVNNGSPVRINLFNYISQNAFANGQFQNLAGVIIARVALGMMNKEFSTIVQAGDTVIRNLVRWFAAYIAVQSPQVMQCLDPAVAQAVTNDSRQWERQAQMVASQIPFEPFAAMQLTETLGNVNSTFGGAGVPMDSGAFVPAGSRGAYKPSNYITNGNDGLNDQTGLDRFQRQMLRRQNRLQGSMQTAMIDNNIAGSVTTPPDQEKENQYAESARRKKEKIARNAQRVPNQSFAAVMGGQSSNGIPIHPALAEEVQVVEDVQETTVVKDFLFTIEINGVDLGVVRELPKDQYATFKWKPSRTQHSHPAWNKAVSKLVYFELENSDWVAVVVTDDKKMTDNDMFKYEAHAIDPTMGIPDPTPIPSPSKEKEKILTSQNKTLHLNIVAPSDSPAVATAESLEHITVMKATSLEKAPDAYFQQASTVDGSSYTTREEMLADLETISGFAVASDWVSLVPMIEKIVNPRTKAMVNKRLTAGVNDWLRYRLGVDITIDSFVEDAPVGLIDALDSIYGQVIVKALKRDASTIVRNSCQVSDGKDQEAVLSNLYGTEGVDISTDRTLIFLHDTAVLWLNRTDEDLALGLPEGGSGTISDAHTPYANAVAKTCFGAIHASNCIEHITVVTLDGAKYRLSRSAIGLDTYLMCAVK